MAAASTRRRQVELLRTEGGQQQAAALQLLAAGIGEQGGGLELGDEFEISLQRQQLQRWVEHNTTPSYHPWQF